LGFFGNIPYFVKVNVKNTPAQQIHALNQTPFSSLVLYSFSMVKEEVNTMEEMQ
jgi:hypothetical protein